MLGYRQRELLQHLPASEPEIHKGGEMTASPNRLTMSVEEYLALDRNSTETRYEYIGQDPNRLKATGLCERALLD